MKKLIYCLAVILAGLFVVSCDTELQPDPEPQVKTVKDVIDAAIDVADLTGATITESEVLDITKIIKVTGNNSVYDVKNAYINVTVSNVILEKLSNIKKLVIADSVGEGDFTISNSAVDEMYVYGGGANSIHIINTTINKLFINKENVRIVLENSTVIKTIDVSKKCTLDSTSEEAKITELNVNETVTDVTLTGKTNVESITAGSADFTVKVESNDVKVTEAVVSTSDGKNYEVKVETAEGITTPEIKVPENITIEPRPEDKVEEPEEQPEEQPEDKLEEKPVIDLEKALIETSWESVSYFGNNESHNPNGNREVYRLNLKKDNTFEIYIYDSFEGTLVLAPFSAYGTWTVKNSKVILTFTEYPDPAYVGRVEECNYKDEKISFVSMNLTFTKVVLEKQDFNLNISLNNAVTVDSDVTDDSVNISITCSESILDASFLIDGKNIRSSSLSSNYTISKNDHNWDIQLSKAFYFNEKGTHIVTLQLSLANSDFCLENVYVTIE